jgi:signal transduction histidine kinase
MKAVGDALTRWASSRFIGPLAVSLAVMVLVVSEAGRVEQQRVNVARAASVETQITVGRLRRALLFMEGAKRGYMLTGRPEYLAPFNEQEQVVRATLAAADAVAERDAEQRELLLRLIEVSRRKYSEMKEVLRLFQAGQGEQAMALMQTDLGEEMLREISDLTDEVLRQENAAYDASTGIRQRVTLYTRSGIWLLVLLCVGGAVALMRVVREQERERQVHLRMVHAERDRLDLEVSRRTAETEALARHMEQVREDERGRLARELHDELGGLLTAAKLDVARLRKRLPPDGGSALELLGHLSQSLDQVIALKRRITEDLRPSSLSNLGLRATLMIQCAEFAQRAELPVATQIDDVSLAPDRALAVYRVVQEAFTNIAKYAQARNVQVALQRVGDQVEIRVEDDGEGFNLDSAEGGGGHGLQGMRFRIRACGGELQVRSTPGQGTSISATLPG